jgi:hypothetical protein
VSERWRRTGQYGGEADVGVDGIEGRGEEDLLGPGVGLVVVLDVIEVVAVAGPCRR